MSYITARDANHRFSQILRDAEAGLEIVITRNGKPVARLIPEPARERVMTPAQEQAWQDTLVFARRAKPDAEPVTPIDRDAFYAERFEKP